MIIMVTIVKRLEKNRIVDLSIYLFFIYLSIIYLPSICLSLCLFIYISMDLAIIYLSSIYLGVIILNANYGYYCEWKKENRIVEKWCVSCFSCYGNKKSEQDYLRHKSLFFTAVYREAWYGQGCRHQESKVSHHVGFTVRM